MIAIGIDNGVTGSIGIISEKLVAYHRTPTIKALNYTKEKQFLRLIDWRLLRLVLEPAAMQNSFCMIERPMINPKRWKASMSAIRALQSTIIVLEMLKIPYQFIDSKEWQGKLLPNGLRNEELKSASLNISKRLFPALSYNKFTDGDGILIAEYCRLTKCRN